MEITKVRCVLPETERTAFDDIVYQRVLGASRHIQMIGQMFEAIAVAGALQGNPAQEIEANILLVADYFKATRGEASCAIGNAIDRMLQEMGELSPLSPQEAEKTVKNAVRNYAQQSKKDIAAVTEYASALASNMKKIMVFDYSSTVNDFLRRLGAAGNNITLYIPESRSINGGYAFVPTALSAGLTVHFIPDAAILFFLKQCDAAFFGAETFYADGTAFNTTGSDLVGLACRELRVPLYVLTPMIKLDIRPIQGYHRQQVINDLKERLGGVGFSDGEREQVEFHCPELLAIEAEYITAFVTEKGIIPSGALYSVALEYAKSLKRG